MISLLIDPRVPVDADHHQDPVDAGYRIAPDPDGLVAVLDGRTSARFTVVRLSPAGVWLASGAAAFAGLQRVVPVSLALGATRVGPLAAELADPPTPPGHPGVVRLRFPSISAEQARRVLEMVGVLGARGALQTAGGRLTTSEIADTPARVARLLKALLAYRCAGFAQGADGRTVHVVGAGFDEEADLPLVWALDGPPPAPPLRFTVTGLLSVYDFVVDRFTVASGLLSAAAPSWLTRTRRRGWRRAAAGPLTLKFRHPRWPEVTVNAEVSDVSRAGLGLQATPVEHLLYPGLEVPEMELREPETDTLQVRARFRHVGPGNGRPAGLSLAEPDPAWDEAVDRRLYARTRAGGSWSGHLWELFEAAGYFRLSGKSKAHFAPLRQSFGAALRRLDGAPWLGCQIVWPSDRGAEAALAAIKAYETSWFGYHMARRPGTTPDGEGARAVLRELHYHAYELGQRDPQVKWLLGYVQAAAGWPRLAHVDFPERHGDDAERACIFRFHARQASTAAAPRPATGGAVGPATDDEIDALLALVAAERPAPYAEALDLVPARARWDDLRRAWRQAGLRRERHFVAARRDGRTLAVGVFEMAEEGVHLYGLLDCVRLYPLARGGESAFPALIEQARAWFRGHGKATFVYLEEYPAPAELAPLGLVDMGAADITLFASDLLPDFIEHIWEVTAAQSAP